MYKEFPIIHDDQEQLGKEETFSNLIKLAREK